MKIVKKLLLSVAILLAVIIIAVCCLGCFLLIPSSFGVEEDELSHAYGRVLADIDGIAETNPRFIDLAFLGSHDSFSSLITPDSEVDDSSSTAIKTLRPLLKNYVYRFAVTQSVGIYDQAMQGARFFHLKATVYDGEWYSSHTLLSGKLETHLLELLRYLTSEQAKGETVGVLFQPVYMAGRTYAELHEFIASVRYNGFSLYDFVHYNAVDAFRTGNGGVKINELRYNDVTKNGEKPGVVLFDRHGKNVDPATIGENDAYPYSFDMDSNAVHVWHDTSTPKKLMESIEKTHNDLKNDENSKELLRMNQTQAAMATHTLSDIYYDLTSVSLLKIAQQHNLALIERADFTDMLATMPVFQVDYLTSTYGDFNNRVNALIRAYNENLCKAA